MTAPTSERVSGLLKWLQGIAVGGLLAISVDAEPHPASRPRVSKWGTYYTKTHQEAAREYRKQITATRLQVNWPEGPLEGPLACLIEVAATRPRTSKLDAPRADVDNYCKLVLDAGTSCKLWEDDSQFQVVAAAKRWALPGEAPGVKLWVGRVTG